MKNKKIIIAGGTGFIGRQLARYFSPDNEIVILTRNSHDLSNNAFADFTLEGAYRNNVTLVEWNGKDAGSWVAAINGSDLVVNLAGKSVNCRYNATNRQEIFDSRTNTTKALADAINKAANPPTLWINAASATIYRDATDRPQDEYTGEYHDDFSVQVCKLWEHTFFNTATPATRKIALRIAITLGEGGVMVPYMTLCKFALGGKQGNGHQMFSWVHIEDLCRVIDFAFANEDMQGVYNVSSPNPVTNKRFMRELRLATGHRIGLPAYQWMLAIGAPVIGTEKELLLKSRWVLPARLLEKGFVFRYPSIQNAFKEIIGKVPRKRYHLFG